MRMVVELNSEGGGITMIRTMVSPSRREKTADRDGFFTPVVVVSIAIAIFAVVTQCLAATGAISLSPTQQLTLWLVAAGLIVLLWIAYMAVQGQTRVTEKLMAATAAAAVERDAARARAAKAELAAKKLAAAADSGDVAPDLESRAKAESRDPWVPPEKLRRLDGSAESVNTADVFPDGCYLDSIGEARGYGEETDTGGAVVGIARARIYPCTVVDRALRDGPHDTVVNILADQKPSLPPGVRHPLVEFDDLTITRYVTDGSAVRMGYELRANGIRPAAGQSEAAS
jgi:hypothetical protein